MKKSRKVLRKILPVGVALLAVAVVLTLLLLRTEAPTTSAADKPEPVKPVMRTQRDAAPIVPKVEERRKAAARPTRRPAPGATRQQPTAPQRQAVPRQAVPEVEEISEERLAALEKWEDFIDVVSEREGVPSDTQAQTFKREFVKLHRDDREDAMQTALNLLPDEQFALLYPILFDKSFDEDILDMIFSDGLNHDDEIKIPMMKAIYQDKTHPMYEEAERILEVTGELDEPE